MCQPSSAELSDEGRRKGGPNEMARLDMDRQGRVCHRHTQGSVVDNVSHGNTKIFGVGSCQFLVMPLIDMMSAPEGGGVMEKV